MSPVTKNANLMTVEGSFVLIAVHLYHVLLCFPTRTLWLFVKVRQWCHRCVNNNYIDWELCKMNSTCVLVASSSTRASCKPRPMQYVACCSLCVFQRILI